MAYCIIGVWGLIRNSEYEFLLSLVHLSPKNNWWLPEDESEAWRVVTEGDDWLIKVRVNSNFNITSCERKPAVML